MLKKLAETPTAALIIGSMVVGLLIAPALVAQDLEGVSLSPIEGSRTEARAVAKRNGTVSARADMVANVYERDHTCIIQTMSCGQTVNSNLTTHDCELSNGTQVDFWEFSGTAGSTVTINLQSNDFDTVAFLLNPVPEVVASDDDGGNGTNSRIVHTLGQSGPWTIAANNFSPGDLGSYSLSLACSGTAGNPPAAPTNLTATTLSTTEIQLLWNDNSNNESSFRVELREQGGTFQEIGSVAANSIGANVTSLAPATTYDFRVRARNANGSSAYSNIATATTNGTSSVCIEDNFTLCLNNERFRVTMDFDTPQNPPARAQALPLASDFSGLFFFSNPDNAEVLIKVIDGCGQNNRYWVFYAATTNVAFDIVVTDTMNGQTRTYSNPLRNPASPIQDTQAFATCP